jgi:hypothetical protein
MHVCVTRLRLDGSPELLLAFLALPLGQGAVQLLRGQELPHVLLLPLLI